MRKHIIQESAEIAEALLEGRKATSVQTKTDGRTMWLDGHRIAWIVEAASAPGIRRLPDRLFTTLAGWNTQIVRDLLNNLLTLAGHGRPYQRTESGLFCAGSEIDVSSVQIWSLPLSYPYPDDTLTARGEAVAARLKKGAANA